MRGGKNLFSHLHCLNSSLSRVGKTGMDNVFQPCYTMSLRQKYRSRRRKARVFSTHGMEPTWSFVPLERELKKAILARIMYTCRKDLEWSNWPNSTTSRFTQVFDRGTWLNFSTFPSFCRFFLPFFLFSSNTGIHNLSGNVFSNLLCKSIMNTRFRTHKSNEKKILTVNNF